MSSWSFRLLDMLRHLAQVPHLSNSAIKIALGTAIVERGIKYFCSNKSIAYQLQHWVNCKREEKARIHGATMPDQVNFIASVGIVDLLLNVNIVRKVGNFWKISAGLKNKREERELLQTINSSMSEIDGSDTEDEDKELLSQITKMG